MLPGLLPGPGTCGHSGVWRSRTAKGGTPHNSLQSSGSLLARVVLSPGVQWSSLSLSPGVLSSAHPGTDDPNYPERGPAGPAGQLAKGTVLVLPLMGPLQQGCHCPGGPCPSTDFGLQPHIQHPEMTPTGSGGAAERTRVPWRQKSTLLA